MHEISCLSLPAPCALSVGLAAWNDMAIFHLHSLRVVCPHSRETVLFSSPFSHSNTQQLGHVAPEGRLSYHGNVATSVAEPVPRLYSSHVTTSCPGSSMTADPRFLLHLSINNIAFVSRARRPAPQGIGARHLRPASLLTVLPVSHPAHGRFRFNVGGIRASGRPILHPSPLSDGVSCVIDAGMVVCLSRSVTSVCH
jgi:hypothetical protein